MYDYYLTNAEVKTMKNYQNITVGNIEEDILNVFELIPTDHHKSFNGRCKVIETKTRIYLLSYETIVCCWDMNLNKFIKLWNDYSATTMRHINSFMDYIGLAGIGGKKWWKSLPYNEPREFSIN